MEITRKLLLGACFVVMLMAAMRMKAQMSEDAGRKEIEAFNKRYVELHLKMDTARVLALWAEDGAYSWNFHRVTESMKFSACSS
jgi:hypothetical protein